MPVKRLLIRSTMWSHQKQSPNSPSPALLRTESVVSLLSLTLTLVLNYAEIDPLVRPVSGELRPIRPRRSDHHSSGDRRGGRVCDREQIEWSASVGSSVVVTPSSTGDASGLYVVFFRRQCAALEKQPICLSPPQTWTRLVLYCLYCSRACKNS